MNARVSKQEQCLEGSLQKQGHYLEGSVQHQGQSNETFYGNAEKSHGVNDPLHANIEDYYQKPKETRSYGGQAEKSAPQFNLRLQHTVPNEYTKFLRQDASLDQTSEHRPIYDLKLMMQSAKGPFVAGFIRLYQFYPSRVSDYSPYSGPSSHIEQSLHASGYALSIPAGLPNNSLVSGQFERSSQTKDGKWHYGDDTIAGQIVRDPYRGCLYFYGTISQRYDDFVSKHRVWVPLTRMFAQSSQVREALGHFDRSYMLTRNSAYTNMMDDPDDDRQKSPYPPAINNFEMPGIIAPSFSSSRSSRLR